MILTVWSSVPAGHHHVQASSVALPASCPRMLELKRPGHACDQCRTVPLLSITYLWDGVLKHRGSFAVLPLLFGDFILSSVQFYKVI